MPKHNPPNLLELRSDFEDGAEISKHFFKLGDFPDKKINLNKHQIENKETQKQEDNSYVKCEKEPVNIRQIFIFQVVKKAP